MRQTKEIIITVCDCCNSQIKQYSGPISGSTNISNLSSVHKVHDKELCFNCLCNISNELVSKDGDIKTEFEKIFNKVKGNCNQPLIFPFNDFGKTPMQDKEL